jgi:hypothetical protein
MNNSDLREAQNITWYVILVKDGNMIKAIAKGYNKYFRCTIKPSNMLRFSNEKSTYKFWENNKGYFERFGLGFIGIKELEVSYKLNV